MLLHLIVVKDNLKGGVVLNNKKYRLFCSFIYHLPRPLSIDPPPNPNCERVTNEFAGNFLITNNTMPSAKGASQSMILWQSDGILPISGTVSVYNSTSSTEAITIEIVGAVTNIFTMFPVIQYRTQEKTYSQSVLLIYKIILHYI